MRREAVDETLAGLGAAHDRIAAAMFAIDSHPGLAYLRGGGLGGLTKTRWATLGPEVDLLWAHFAVLGDLLERARSIRSQRRPDDDDWNALRLICSEPVVGLDKAGLPVESAPTTRVRLWDLAAQLERRCASVTGLLSDVDSAWSVVAGRYAPLTQEIDALVARLSALRERVGALVGIRDAYPRRIAELGALIEQVGAAEQRVAEAYARVTGKIADTGLPPAPHAAGVLQARLTRLDRTYHQARWAQLADDVAALERTATQARQRSDELREAADGLLARRDELRGRLDAYRAKAARLGYAEHDGLTALHTRARELLYTAPCDLRAATRAVFAYQQALAALPGPTGDGGNDDR